MSDNVINVTAIFPFYLIPDSISCQKKTNRLTLYICKTKSEIELTRF